ncbi:MAG: hypothetical protein JW919_03075 [Candidatus Omnitrophica bacterium]|nr:hypothetical protein [Candidatus Omnitrophota bacterium]
MNKKAIALLSGGLDSILAIRLLQEQGVEIEAVNFYIDFAACIPKIGGEDAAKKAARLLNIPLTVVDITPEYLEMFKNPRHGYGANINPCIDCKIFMLKRAKAMMAERGASFLVTGEVLGERPMSQRRDALNIIERDAGVRGILLRPLSAKVLNPTLPEKEGAVDREKLLGITGRGRKPQMELAEKFGIKEYPNPAGGCLLTDPGFTGRVEDLVKHNALDIENLKLLKCGRHFRLSPTAKLAVGRDDRDNDLVMAEAKEGDICLRLADYPSPFCLLRGATDDDTVHEAARVVAYHTKLRDRESLRIDYWKEGSPEHRTISVKPASLEEISAMRI